MIVQHTKDDINVMYLNTPYKIQYDTKRFPFRKVVENILETPELEKIHELDSYDVLTRDRDQKTKWHKTYYEKFCNEFQPLYIELVKHLKERFGYEEIIYQKIPTFRAHLVGNLGVGEWHRDRSYNHGSTEVNFWLPFTDTYETNTIWVESREGLEDFCPYNVKYGEILVFDGANLMHGNKINETQSSRVSVDFRLVDPKIFTPTTNGSINMNTPFDIGGYFEKK